MKSLVDSTQSAFATRNSCVSTNKIEVSVVERIASTHNLPLRRHIADWSGCCSVYDSQPCCVCLSSTEYTRSTPIAAIEWLMRSACVYMFTHRWMQRLDHNCTRTQRESKYVYSQQQCVVKSIARVFWLV